MKMLILALALVVSLTAGAAEEFYQLPQKKLIEFSWASPEPDFLRRNIEEIERTCPYDGIGIRFMAQMPDGSRIDSRHMFSGTAVKREHLAVSIDALKQTPFRRLKENFLMTGIVPGNVELFDDKGWKVVCDNIAALASAARECGLRGLLFDGEVYESNPFLYHPGKGYSFDDAAARARQRGREFGKAAFSAYPDMVFFTFFAMNPRFRGEPDSHVEPFSLYGFFIMGLYDELPPGVRIVDGCETSGYAAESEASYRMLLEHYKLFAIRQLGKEHRAKFYAQTLFGPGTYLDPYVYKRPGNQYYERLRPDITDHAAYLRRNLFLALSVSDEYAWTWGEYNAWWPSGRAQALLEKDGGGIWEEKLPGITAAVEFARRPLEMAVKERRKQPRPNLLVNGSFEEGMNAWSDAGTAPPKIGHGRGIEGGAAADFSGIEDGLVIQQIKVQPGKFYYVGALAKTAGNGVSYLLARWVTPAGKWVQEFGVPDSVLTFQPTGDSDWKCAEEVFLAPENAAHLLIGVGAKQRDKGDSALIDKVEAVELF